MQCVNVYIPSLLTVLRAGSKELPEERPGGNGLPLTMHLVFISRHRHSTQRLWRRLRRPLQLQTQMNLYIPGAGQSLLATSLPTRSLLSIISVMTSLHLPSKQCACLALLHTSTHCSSYFFRWFSMLIQIGVSYLIHTYEKRQHRVCDLFKNMENKNVSSVE